MKLNLHKFRKDLQKKRKIVSIDVNKMFYQVDSIQIKINKKTLA